MAKLNFSEVAEGFEPLPEGEYEARVAEITLEEGPKGKYGKIEFEIASGDFDGRKLWLNASHAPKALWRSKGTYIRIGVDPEWINGNPDDDEPEFLETLRECIGNDVSLVVTQEEYDPGDGSDPRIQNRIEKVLPAGAAALPF